MSQFCATLPLKIGRGCNTMLHKTDNSDYFQRNICASPTQNCQWLSTSFITDITWIPPGVEIPPGRCRWLQVIYTAGGFRTWWFTWCQWLSTSLQVIWTSGNRVMNDVLNHWQKCCAKKHLADYPGFMQQIVALPLTGWTLLTLRALMRLLLHTS